MRYLPPVRWADVRPGTVVMLNGTPRAVIDRLGDLFLAEGLPPFNAPGGYAYPVELDTADAIGTLYTAGLNPVPIEERA